MTCAQCGHPSAVGDWCSPGCYREWSRDLTDHFDPYSAEELRKKTPTEALREQHYANQVKLRRGQR